jgi:hypothetical protein
VAPEVASEVKAQVEANFYIYYLVFDVDDLVKAVVPSKLSEGGVAFAPTLSLGVLITWRG